MARAVAGFANAEGGVLVLGIEDDHSVTGHHLSATALKFHGLVESWESRPSSLTPEQLDPTLIARAKQGAGPAALSNEEYLLKRKLADRRGARIQLRRAAELLFAVDGADQPNAGVRVFRVIGTERRTGPEHEVEELPRVEGNLPAVIEAANSIVAGLLRRPSRLFGTRFRPVPEYPEFSWKEGLLNAVAHRDYKVEGLGTVELSDEEFRALLHAHRSGRVENGDLRLLVGLDTLKASNLLRRLRDRGLLHLHPRGANSFYTLSDGSALSDNSLVQLTSLANA